MTMNLSAKDFISIVVVVWSTYGWPGLLPIAQRLEARGQTQKDKKCNIQQYEWKTDLVHHTLINPLPLLLPTIPYCELLDFISQEISWNLSMEYFETPQLSIHCTTSLVANSRKWHTFDNMSLADLYCAVLDVKFDLAPISHNRLILSTLKSSQNFNYENKSTFILGNRHGKSDGVASAFDVLFLSDFIFSSSAT